MDDEDNDELLVGEVLSLVVEVTQNDPLTGKPVLDGSGNPVKIDDNSMTLSVWHEGTLRTPSPVVAHLSLGTYMAQLLIDAPGWWLCDFQGSTTAPGRGRTSFYASPVP